MTISEAMGKAKACASKNGWAYLVARRDGAYAVITPAEVASGARAVATRLGATFSAVYVKDGMGTTFEAVQGKRMFRALPRVFVGEGDVSARETA